MRSARVWRRRARRVGSRVHGSVKAARAAVTAVLTSVSVAALTEQISSSVLGTISLESQEGL